MEPDELLAELQRVADKLQVQVRYESTGGRVGRCLLYGEMMVWVDRYLPLRDRIEGLAQALADLEYEALFMPEFVRNLLLSRRRDHSQLPLPHTAR
jgi:hypothetical protein